MILLAQVGCGTQAQRQVNTGIGRSGPTLQFVAVVDPNRDTQNYVDWSADGNRSRVRQFLEDPTVGRRRHRHPRRPRRGARRSWRPTTRSSNRPAAASAPTKTSARCSRRKRDIQGIVNITPDHQHGSINIAALKKGKAAISHKPVAQRALRSAAHARGGARRAPRRRTCSPTATRPTGTRWRRGSRPASSARCAKCTTGPTVRSGRRGCRSITRPGPPVPDGLQLDAVAGAGARSSVPSELHVRGLSRLVCVRHRLPRRHGPLQPVAAVSHPEPRRAGVGRGPAEQRGRRRRAQRQHRADASRWSACPRRARSAGGIRRRPTRPAVDTFWYDGGMKPQTPEELYADNEDLADEGMLFVGDKGKILCDFRANKPRLIPQSRHQAFEGSVSRDGRRHDDARRRVDQRDQEAATKSQGQLRAGRARSPKPSRSPTSRCACPTSACCGTPAGWRSPTPPRPTGWCDANNIGPAGRCRSRSNPTRGYRAESQPVMVRRARRRSGGIPVRSSGDVRRAPRWHSALHVPRATGRTATRCALRSLQPASCSSNRYEAPDERVEHK